MLQLKHDAKESYVKCSIFQKFSTISLSSPAQDSWALLYGRNNVSGMERDPLNALAAELSSSYRREIYG